MENFKKQNDRGFTLLFAVLIAILVLAIGASIINLALKQIKLSGNARESQFAFYAANTGIECALYWDFHPNSDGDVVFKYDGGPSLYSDTGNVECVGDVFMEDGYWDTTWNGTSWTTDFRISFEGEGDIEYCADVQVEKTVNVDDTIDTIVRSSGYNTCDVNNPRRVERGLRMVY